MKNDSLYYWGEPDTTVEFCEKKYDVFFWIAEYDNTFSALPYLLIGLLFQMTKIKKIGNAVIILGLSTIIMHSTLRYYGQWFDECSMIYLSFETIKLLRKKTSYIFLPIIITLYFYFKNNYLFFLCLFTLLQCIIIYLFINKRKNSMQTLFIRLYFFSFLLAIIFWVLDQKICTVENYVPYHALWHFFSAIAIFYGYTSFII